MKKIEMASNINQLKTSYDARVEIYEFCTKNGVGECHIMIHADQNRSSAAAQIDGVMATYNHLKENELKGYVPVFRRFFLSDAANQESLVCQHLDEEKETVATSVVEQAPLDGTKVALWVYFVKDATCRLLDCGLVEATFGNYRHLWGGTTTLKDGNSEQQTYRLLTGYATQLAQENLTLENDCIRTWFFVQNVDVNYEGVVHGRNDVFALHDLTSKTHFITSTGIGGRSADKNILVQMNTYAVGGLENGQINFLYAKDFLNPTYEYGVSFERGTYVDYGDRRHVFISGTASIDNKGNVVHVGDIEKQVERMWQNVEALLEEAECGFQDLGQMLVYLRDPADYAIVKRLFDMKFPDVPKVILLAPVCRPTWLIEMECIALKEMQHPSYKNL